MQSLSDYLFAQPSFLGGMARIFDFGGSLNTFNEAHSTSEADALGHAVDWDAIARDFTAAFEQFKCDHPDVVAAAQR